MHAVELLYSNKQLATYKTYQASEYLRNLLEYNSLRDPHLKFQNGGNGACSVCTWK